MYDYLLLVATKVQKKLYFLLSIIRKGVNLQSLILNAFMITAIFFILLIITFSSCSQNSASNSINDNNRGEKIEFRHAKLVKAVKYADTLRIDICNPWDTTKLLRSISVKTPIERAAVYSATHAALLVELGVADRIGGIFDIPYLKNEVLQSMIAEDRIRNLGSSNSVGIEDIMYLQPDILMPSPYENNGGYGRLEQMGIPIMECADYMEVSPLARAEWIKIYGSLFGVAAKADSLFNAIEAKYISLRDLTDRQEKKPRLLTERPFSGAWHVPCGESTTGQLYRDAGADYIFSDLHGTGARAISIEEVLNRASDADFWLIKSFGDVTKKDILKDMPLLRILPARLVVCNTDVVPFFEETPFHPEYLLENLIALFHPELGIVPEHEYFRVNEK